MIVGPADHVVRRIFLSWTNGISVSGTPRRLYSDQLAAPKGTRVINHCPSCSTGYGLARPSSTGGL